MIKQKRKVLSPSRTKKKTASSKKSRRSAPVRPRKTSLKKIAVKEHEPIKRMQEFVDTYELPECYNTTNVTLIARDPRWIHAYWEISSHAMEDLRSKIGDEFDRSSVVLRMYDVTLKDFDGTNANHWFDLNVGRHANNWYINVWSDNVTYCGEIGLRTSQGQFYPFARSNFVTTPRQGLSGRSDTIWMEVKNEEPASPQPFVYLSKRQPGRTNFDQAKIYRRRRMNLTAEDIRAYYLKLFPLLRLVRSRFRINGKKGGKLFGSYVWDRYLLEKYSTLSKSKYFKKMLLGSSAELILQGGASELTQVTSPGGASERQQIDRKFFFELATELIVYGRTEPNATVTHGGKSVPLRPDGTFTLRFALPDGTIPLDFKAESYDKIDTREIRTAAERHKTVYNP